MTVTFQYLGKKKDAQGWEHFAYSATLMHKGQTWSGIDYKTGLGWVTIKPYRGGIGGERIYNALGPGKDGYAIRREPTAADVLGSLLSDARTWNDAQDFEDFCASLGYDTDSKRAQAIYAACGEAYKRLRAFLGAEFDTLMAMDESELPKWMEANA